MDSATYSTRDAADLISAHTNELSKIARNVGLDALGHILEMATLEAREAIQATQPVKHAA